MGDCICKKNLSCSSELDKPTIPPVRSEEDELEPLEYIDNTYNNISRDGTSEMCVIKIPRFISCTSEGGIVSTTDPFIYECMKRTSQTKNINHIVFYSPFAQFHLAILIYIYLYVGFLYNIYTFIYFHDIYNTYI